jgi:uncharacterized membrane protein YhhN
MMQNKSKAILILYIIIGALQVTGILWQITLLHQSLKVLLMPVLAFYLWNSIEEKSKNNLFLLSILALAFSYSGDIILMIPGNNPLFFIGGLVSFLVAHLFYTKLFTTLSPLNKNILKKNPIWIIAIILFLIAFLSYLVPKIDTSLKIPVIAYGLIICTMLLSALHLKERIGKSPYKMIVAGAILFVLSDSILALNKFDPAFRGITFMHALVMITYISAQGFIIHGIKKCSRQEHNV